MRIRSCLIVTAVALPVVAGCGVGGAWFLGVLTSDGRFPRRAGRLPSPSRTTPSWTGWSRTAPDVHVVFRVSNAVVDVSGRPHARPGPWQRRLVARLARAVASWAGA